MSRSLHTQKLEIRAGRRSVRPFSHRREEAEYLSGRKKSGTLLHSLRISIKSQKPLPGLCHAVTPREIRSFLIRLGHASYYRLRAINIRRECGFRPTGIVFAEYAVPDEIQLFALPQLPWSLPFLLSVVDFNLFESYGASLVVDHVREYTVITWSPSGLQQFVLCEVLAHELGHHLLQTRKSQGSRSRYRTSDHEKRAGLYAMRANRILARSAVSD